MRLQLQRQHSSESGSSVPQNARCLRPLQWHTLLNRSQSTLPLTAFHCLSGSLSCPHAHGTSCRAHHQKRGTVCDILYIVKHTKYTNRCLLSKNHSHLRKQSHDVHSIFAEKNKARRSPSSHLRQATILSWSELWGEKLHTLDKQCT